MAGGSGVRKRRDKVRTLVTCGKKFVAFLFSHVGLCALMIAYTMLGSVLFRAIERNHERDLHHYVRTSRSKAVNGMWWATYNYHVKLDIWSANVSTELNEFKWVLLRIIQKGYDAKDQEENTQWTFAGAFLYSLSVITTIGYGNIACRTLFGKAMTIVYAILGIPLMLLFLTNIGDVLARVFKFLYRKTVRLKMEAQIWHKRRKAERIRRTNSLTPAVLLYNRNQPRQAQPESRLRLISSSFFRAHPDEDPTITDSPDRRHKRSFLSSKPSIRVRQVSTGTQTSGHLLRRSSSHRMSTSSAGSTKGSKRGPSPTMARPWATVSTSDSSQMAALLPQPQFSTTTDDVSMEQIRGETLLQKYELEEYSLRESMEDKLNKLTVPLWLVFSTMLAYLMAGAVLFTVWEQWTFFNAFYFCYISLATIGFGDLFPAASLRDAASAQEKLSITSVYLLFGMALIAMCFNLAQEEVVNKMTTIADKLGLVRSSSQVDESVCETES